MVSGTGFYPDGVVLAGVTKAMAEQYAPDQLKKGLLKVPQLSNIATTARALVFVDSLLLIFFLCECASHMAPIIRRWIRRMAA